MKSSSLSLSEEKKSTIKSLQLTTQTDCDTEAKKKVENESETKISEVQENLLSDDYYDLAEAIENNRPSDVIKFIRAGINLNVEIPFDNTDYTVYTPLGISVFQLNLDITKMLLENGADPNLINRDNRSLIEELMSSIGITDMKSISKNPPTNPFKIFGIETPIQVKIVLTPERIEVAHKILDLLLCYGLKPNFEWTASFKDGTKNLTDFLQNRHQANIERKAKPVIFIKKLQQKALKQGLLKTIDYAAGFRLTLLCDDLETQSRGNIPSFLASVSVIKPKINEAAMEIKQEKDKLLKEYRTEIAKGAPVLPIVIIDLIIHYAIFLSEEISIRRQREYRTVKFWTQVKDDKKQVEREVKRYIQYSEYKSATSLLKSSIGKTAQKIVIDYLLETANEPDESKDLGSSAIIHKL